MGKIHLLERNIAELIAAGEVIERPASIVKELIENSIDAGSSAITIEIKRGGIQYIRITDNGSGMTKDDIPIAFQRHATSKILTADDLDQIATLGFRGEALASISAVSRLELTSKTEDCQFGNRIMLEAGEEKAFEEVGCSDGTTIIVKDLFYNVPARLKFLKQDNTEGNVIAGMVDKLALSHPETSFKLISDQKIKLHTPGNGDLLSAIHSVFGKEFSTALIEVAYEYNGIKVYGYTSKTTTSRTNRSMQHFFVNSRYVRSKVCVAAIEGGYKNAIMTGKYPFCVLKIDVPYNSVDVNVHPSKIEIRFINERVVFDAIYFAIKSAIVKSDSLNNAVHSKHKLPANLLSTFKNEESEQTKLEKQNDTVKYNEFTTEVTKITTVSDNHRDYQKEKPDSIKQNPDILNNKNENNYQYISAQSFTQSKQEQKKPVIKLEEPLKTVSSENHNEIQQEISPNKINEINDMHFRMIGELFKTYVLFEANESFILLDKHAAHERILYEKLKNSVNTQERQLLLKPVVVSVSSSEFIALTSNTEILNKIGFVIEEFGNNTISVREVPLILTQYDIQAIVLDIANKLNENKRDISSDIFENLLHSIACRSAIKANDTTSTAELIELIKLVISNDEIRHCPHGRPIVIVMTKAELEKRFGRIQ